MLSSTLRGIRPRDGFGPELWACLLDEGHGYGLVEIYGGDARRRRWLVVGAVAGMVSVTGLAYAAARKHHGGAA
jgi:hypothetical protein